LELHIHLGVFVHWAKTVPGRDVSRQSRGTSKAWGVRALGREYGKGPAPAGEAEAGSGADFGEWGV
jgi:hypothetical protein